MNKTLKMVLAAAGALVLGGLGEGIGTALLKKAANDDDTAEDTNEEPVATEEPTIEVEDVSETTED